MPSNFLKNYVNGGGAGAIVPSDFGRGGCDKGCLGSLAHARRRASPSLAPPPEAGPRHAPCPYHFFGISAKPLAVGPTMGAGLLADVRREPLASPTAPVTWVRKYAIATRISINSSSATTSSQGARFGRSRAVHAAPPQQLAPGRPGSQAMATPAETAAHPIITAAETAERIKKGAAAYVDVRCARAHRAWRRRGCCCVVAYCHARHALPPLQRRLLTPNEPTLTGTCMRLCYACPICPSPSSHCNAPLSCPRTPEEFSDGHVPGAVNIPVAVQGAAGRKWRVRSGAPSRRAQPCCSSQLAPGARAPHRARRLIGLTRPSPCCLPLLLTLLFPSHSSTPSLTPLAASHENLEPNPHFVEEVKKAFPDSGSEIILVGCTRHGRSQGGKTQHSVCCIRITSTPAPKTPLCRDPEARQQRPAPGPHPGARPRPPPARRAARAAVRCVRLTCWLAPASAACRSSRAAGPAGPRRACPSRSPGPQSRRDGPNGGPLGGPWFKEAGRRRRRRT
jgi:hypothetical protein